MSVGRITSAQRAVMSEHFCSCEFCRAELEFYRHYPQAKDTPEFQTIPEPLFELATSLLNHNRDLSPLYKLMNGGN
ncbi:MAG TPA: hypothetical protein VJL58_06775 [Pyrinomonadaceae bacterium]|nr:hypothetical protein [Pyrinomonadaceae bacterium]